MKNSVLYITIIFILIIAGTLVYKNLIYKPVLEEKITINEEFEITTEQIYKIKDVDDSSFKITKIGASLSGYFIDYNLKIGNNTYNKDNIEKSNYIVNLISSDYKTKANFIIQKKD